MKELWKRRVVVEFEIWSRNMEEMRKREKKYKGVLEGKKRDHHQ
jgi:hypothetical protein